MNDQRRQFYQQFESVFPWWDSDQYAYYDVLEVKPQTIAAIKQAARGVWRVLLEAAGVMCSYDDQTLLDYGYPSQTLPLIRSITQPSFLARCDFVVNSYGEVLLLECNAEIATFIVETFRMNGVVAQHFGLEDPNPKAEQILKQGLGQYLCQAAASVNKDPNECNIVFAALSDTYEDYYTARYLSSICPYPSKVQGIESLTFDRSYAFDESGSSIDLLFKLYPTEWMIEDRAPETGKLIWDYYEPVVKQKHMAVVNPMTGFVLQNKGLLTLVTDLGAAFFGEDAGTVYDHFLPTYGYPDPFLSGTQVAKSFVAKPTYGREGKEVYIFRQGEDTYTTANRCEDYLHHPKVFQQYSELPTIHLGEDDVTVQYSCFLVNGEPVGVAARAGSEIIQDLSWFLPIGLEPEG